MGKKRADLPHRIYATAEPSSRVGSKEVFVWASTSEVDAVRSDGEKVVELGVYELVETKKVRLRVEDA